MFSTVKNIVLFGLLVTLVMCANPTFAQFEDPNNGGDLVVPMRGLRARSGHANYGMWGVSTGLMSYRGELVGNNFYRQMRPCFGLSYTRRMVTRLYMRFGFTLGGIQGYDRLSSQTQNQDRNLSFKSSITELHTAFLYQFADNPRRCDYRPTTAPYVMLGGGAYHFNPRAQLGGEWHALQPLGTEGQFFPDAGPGLAPYSRIQGNVLAGVGIHRKVSKLINMRVEVAYRFLFTDYLDDVSGYYPDMERMQVDNPTAFLLADRRNRLEHGIAESGSLRGDDRKTDSYFSFTVALQRIPARHAVK